jgi:hypothetical protein
MWVRVGVGDNSHYNTIQNGWRSVAHSSLAGGEGVTSSPFILTPIFSKKNMSDTVGGAVGCDPNILFAFPLGRVYRPNAFHNELKQRVKHIIQYLKDKKDRWEREILLQCTYCIHNRSFGSHKTTGRPIGIHQEYNGSHGRSVTLTFFLDENETVWRKQLEELFFGGIENTLKLLTQSTEEVYVVRKFRVTRVDSESGRYSPICH